MFKVESRREAALWFALLVAPLVVGLVWGVYLNDSAYVTFRYARNLAAGRGLTDNRVAEEQTVFETPLYVLVLALLARLGIPLPQVGLVLSTLGCGAAAIAIYCAGRAMHRPVAALVSAMLVVFSPVVTSTLGTDISWAAAWAWIAIASSVKKRWNVQTVALALMLGTHLDSSTLALATLLLVVQWIERRRFPLGLGLILAVAALGWGSAVIVYCVPVIPHGSLIVSHWSLAAQRLLDESEFYWLFIPLLLCGIAGLLSVARRVLWAGLLWGSIAIVSSGTASEVMMVTLGLFLAGLGIDWIIEWVEARGAICLDRFTLAVSLALVAGVPLGMAQASSLLQRYQFRPVVRHALEQQAGDWLCAYSKATATVFGSERVGYLADRTTLPWDGNESEQAELASLIQTLNQDPPDYCVSFKSIAWNRLIQADWFQDNYVPLQEFESPYDATSPFTVWGYRFRGVDWGERQPLNVQLPQGVNWIGYSHSPDLIQSGDAVHVTFFLQATQPFTEPFHAVVEIISPSDGAGWARQAITPSNVLMGWWQAGDVIARRVVMTTTPDISTGAYHLDAHVVPAGSKTRLPFYRDNNTSPLDRITLGYVVVPWRDDLALDRARPVDGTFGDQIRLLGFEAMDNLSPGAEFDVTLYWESLRSPDDDYIVFVHLLDAEGQVVASHDGPPMGGRYTTKAWIPGEIVPDVHRLALDPNSPVGTYRLQVGMYRWPDMERLSVWDSQRVEQAGRVLVLQPVEVQSDP